MFYSSLCCPPDIAGTAVRAFASGAAEVLAGMDDKALEREHSQLCLQQLSYNWKPSLAGLFYSL
jgi:hypothetical protein